MPKSSITDLSKYYQWAVYEPTRKDHLFNILPSRSRTRSTNFAVLKLYSFIYKHENWDTDYWWIGGGDMELLQILTEHFEEKAWIDLSKDIKNWSGAQLEILTYSVTAGLYDCIPKSIEEKTLPSIITLLQSLLKLSKSKNLGSYINSQIAENSDFFTSNFDLILKTVPNAASILPMIFELSGIIHQVEIQKLATQLKYKT